MTYSLLQLFTLHTIDMEVKEFYMLVRKMRNLQKEYFSTRENSVLLESKKAEREVDEELNKTFFGIESLFDNEDRE